MTSGPHTGIKPLLLPPRLRTPEDGDGRRASYLGLFDLVFVVAIAQLAHELDHSLRGMLVGLALASSTLDPVLFTGLVTVTLVLLVAFKLWSAQPLLRATA